MNNSIGFMQGRLSPQVDGKIQAFPWEDWRTEFPLAEQAGFGLMEWTLDQDRLYENPLLTKAGQDEILKLRAQHGIRVASLTGDCFMQAPFWKANGAVAEALKNDFVAVARACHAVGADQIVVPLVDNGGIESQEQEDALVGFMLQQLELLKALSVAVVFESDFCPAELARLIERFPQGVFGVNYDIGNSAALGYSAREEFAAYGQRILNVHVKDRVFRGTTVPLGTGNADFDAVFSELSRLNYAGRYILQTARAADGDHIGTLSRYGMMTEGWMRTYGLVS